MTIKEVDGVASALGSALFQADEILEADSTGILPEHVVNEHPKPAYDTS